MNVTSLVEAMGVHGPNCQGEHGRSLTARALLCGDCYRWIEGYRRLPVGPGDVPPQAPGMLLTLLREARRLGYFPSLDVTGKPSGLTFPTRLPTTGSQGESLYQAAVRELDLEVINPS